MQGVIGVYSGDNAIQKALNNLYGVQHRGQESAGMSAAGDNSLRTWKGKGLVSNVFRELFRSFMHPNDYVVIGCASGENASKGSLPPIEYESDRYRLSLTLDGHVQNKGSRLNEEIVGSLIMEKLQEGDGIDIAIGETMKEIHNAYFSMVAALLDKDNRRSELIAARDSRGIRPLYLAMNEDELFVASESAPIDVMESMGQRIEERRDIKPGSLVRRNDDGLTERQLVDPQYAHCAFEWVYFGRPDSIIEGRNVHSVRKRLGQALVETYSLKTTYGIVEGPRKDIVVIPIPDSGRSVCVGVAEALGVTADEGVIKNAYLGRTYIIDDPEFRRIASDLKHNIIKETVRGKKVIITDDSIVRGTVSESVAKNLIKAGAAEVEYLISYAPIYHPCFSDPPDKPLAAAPYEGRCLAEIGELVASNLPSINEVRYNSPENVIDAIGLPSGRLCTYCVTGENPLIKTRAPEIAIRDSSLGK
jgi:amidophosphoribosyltransferase